MEPCSSSSAVYQSTLLARGWVGDAYLAEMGRYCHWSCYWHEGLLVRARVCVYTYIPEAPKASIFEHFRTGTNLEIRIHRIPSQGGIYINRKTCMVLRVPAAAQISFSSGSKLSSGTLNFSIELEER